MRAVRVNQNIRVLVWIDKQWAQTHCIVLLSCRLSWWFSRFIIAREPFTVTLLLEKLWFSCLNFCCLFIYEFTVDRKISRTLEHPQQVVFTFALFRGAATPFGSTTFLSKGRHLPLQPLQTLPKGSKVHLTAAGPRAQSWRNQFDLMGQHQGRTRDQVDFFTWEVQRWSGWVTAETLCFTFLMACLYLPGWHQRNHPGWPSPRRSPPAARTSKVSIESWFWSPIWFLFKFDIFESLLLSRKGALCMSVLRTHCIKIFSKRSGNNFSLVFNSWRTYFNVL